MRKFKLLGALGLSLSVLAWAGDWRLVDANSEYAVSVNLESISENAHWLEVDVDYLSVKPRALEDEPGVYWRGMRFRERFDCVKTASATLGVKIFAGVPGRSRIIREEATPEDVPGDPAVVGSVGRAMIELVCRHHERSNF